MALSAPAEGRKARLAQRSQRLRRRARGPTTTGRPGASTRAWTLRASRAAPPERGRPARAPTATGRRGAVDKHRGRRRSVRAARARGTRGCAAPRRHSRASSTSGRSPRGSPVRPSPSASHGRTASKPASRNASRSGPRPSAGEALHRPLRFHVPVSQSVEQGPGRLPRMAEGEACAAAARTSGSGSAISGAIARSAPGRPRRAHRSAARPRATALRDPQAAPKPAVQTGSAEGVLERRARSSRGGSRRGDQQRKEVLLRRCVRRAAARASARSSRIRMSGTARSRARPDPAHAPRARAALRQSPRTTRLASTSETEAREEADRPQAQARNDVSMHHGAPAALLVLFSYRHALSPV